MKSNDFDKIAFAYDKLARLIFGRAIMESQQFFLNKVPDHSSVLILGGGSGWILGKLREAKPSVEICYIEASQNMISLAKGKMKGDKRIQFINGTESEIPNGKYDVVITNFYLDLFNEQSLKTALQKIRTSLAPDGKWLVTDFVNDNWWHGPMLQIMYIFFKATTRIEAGRLPKWSTAIAHVGGTKIDWKFFYRGFIETAVFQF